MWMHGKKRVCVRVIFACFLMSALYYGLGYLGYAIVSSTGSDCFGYRIIWFHPLVTRLGVARVALIAENNFLVTRSPWRGYAVNLLRRECARAASDETNPFKIGHFAMCYGLLWQFTGNREDVIKSMLLLSRLQGSNREALFHSACFNMGLEKPPEELCRAVLDDAGEQKIRDVVRYIDQPRLPEKQGTHK